MSKSIACCLLSHNHPNIIETNLSEMAEGYIRHNIDIYVCDSSDDEATKCITEKYSGMYPGHVYYMDMHFTKNGDEKMFYVLQGHGLKKHYDFVWPVKDRCYFGNEVLDKISLISETNPDVILIADENDRWELKSPDVKECYDDPVEFFGHYGHICSNWEGVIRNTSTMVDRANWDDLKGRYNLGAENGFNQPVSLFALLADKPECKINVIQCGLFDKHVYPGEKSGWHQCVIDVWLDKWVPAVYGLPSVYDKYKTTIIKAELGLPGIFGSTESFIDMKDSGQLTDDRYKQLKNVWAMITDYPQEYFDMIYNDQITELLDIIRKKFDESFEKKQYEDSYRIFSSNSWFELIYGKNDYDNLKVCFYIYKCDYNSAGESGLFDNVTSVEQLLERFRELTC